MRAAIMARIFGPVMQNAFVVPDLDAAIAHWTGVMHVGPFFLFKRVEFEQCLYRGAAATAVDMDVAIAYWGDLQIELIQQHNDVPSIFTEFRARGLTGMQHVGVLTDSVDRDVELLARQGVHPVQHGKTTAGLRFAYMSTDFHPGGMVELIQPPPRGLSFFEKMRTAAQNWDGTTRVHPIG
jgi:hypothetical protein